MLAKKQLVRHTQWVWCVWCGGSSTSSHVEGVLVALIVGVTSAPNGARHLVAVCEFPLLEDATSLVLIPLWFRRTRVSVLVECLLKQCSTLGDDFYLRASEAAISYFDSGVKCA